MKISIVGGLILSAALATSALAAPATNYKIVDRIKVPDGGFDYATFDAATGNVLMARTDFTTVIDTKTGKVSDLKSPNHGHIALPVPGTPLLILTQRAGTVRIVDKTKDSVVADLLVGKNPDGATYDPLTKMVFVMNHDDGNSTVVDLAAKKSVATIHIGGELEFPVSDGAGKVFVNVADVPEIAVIDVKTKMVTGRYKLNGCMDASGLAYIAPAKLLISACANQMAKVIQADTGKEVATLKIGANPDAVIYDAQRKLAFIPSGGAGLLEVISVADPAHVEVIQHLQTAPGTRTGTVDPTTGKLYLMSSKPDPNAKGRGQRLAGSYEVLVVGP